MTISLLLAHAPKAKPRPHSRPGGGRYSPKDYEDWRGEIALLAQEQYRGEPLTCPLQVSIIIAGPQRGRADLESYVGALMDALGGYRKGNRPGIAFDDDDQILVLEARFEAAPDWLLSVTIREIAAPDYPKPAKKKKAKA